MSKTIAILLAAGEGNRCSSFLPKQYTLIHGKPIIIYSFQTFLEHPLIDYILPVINPEHEYIFNKILGNYNLRHHIKILPYIFGGNERKISVLNALKHINLTISTVDKVLIHDSARPFVSKQIINEVVTNTTKTQGCIPILKITDSIKKIDHFNNIIQDVDRNLYVKTQTPQGFPFKELLQAYESFIDKPATDDAAIFINSGLNINIVNGSELNKKITTKDDLVHLEKLNSTNIYSNKIEYRTGQGFDVHRFVDNKPLYLGGVKIPYDKGLLGHSDADVVIHALVDAMLGSISQGDIGDHFPPSELTWKDADSKLFLLKAKKLFALYNASVINIDITIICEEPILTSYKKLIQINLAKILDIKIEKVNIKATTTEKLGFLGRKEGIATLANVSVLVNHIT